MQLLESGVSERGGGGGGLRSDNHTTRPSGRHDPEVLWDLVDGKFLDWVDLVVGLCWRRASEWVE